MVLVTVRARPCRRGELEGDFQRSPGSSPKKSSGLGQLRVRKRSSRDVRPRAAGALRRRPGDLRGDRSGCRVMFSRVAHDAIGVVWVESWPDGQKTEPKPGCHRRRYCATRREAGQLDSDRWACPHVLSAPLRQSWWPRLNSDRFGQRIGVCAEPPARREVQGDDAQDAGPGHSQTTWPRR